MHHSLAHHRRRQMQLGDRWDQRKVRLGTAESIFRIDAGVDGDRKDRLHLAKFEDIITHRDSAISVDRE